MFSLIFTGIVLTAVCFIGWLPYFLLKDIIRYTIWKVFGLNLYTKAEMERAGLIKDPYAGKNPTIQDIRKREVANWLCFSLIAVVLAIRAVHSIVYQDLFYFLQKNLHNCLVF